MPAELKADNEASKHPARWRRARRWWLLLWPITIFLIVFPISTGCTRLMTLCGIGLLWIGVVGFYWSAKWLRCSVIGLGAVVVLGFCLPGKEIRKKELREAYVQALRSYTGTRYI